MQSTRLQDLMELYCVPRWTTHPVTRGESVAEHSYRVAILALEIQERLASASGVVIPCADLIRYALVHDGSEARIGDIPSPAKREIEGFNGIELRCCPWLATEYERMKIIPHIREIVQLADLIEAWDWAKRYASHRVDRFTGHHVYSTLADRIWRLTEASELPDIGGIISRLMMEISQ